MEYPGVGICVYVRKDGKVLLGKRRSIHGKGEWCAPGGKMEMNESPEECAIRETREETGLEIQDVRFISYTNDIWDDIGTHYVTLSFVADWKMGEVRVVEQDKFEEWKWFSLGSLPGPLFLSTQNFLAAGINPLVF